MAHSLAAQILASHTEAQRQAQRARAAQERQRREAQQAQLRAQREAERARARYDRAALQTYQYRREQDVEARNRQIDESMAELEQLLVSSLSGMPFHFDLARSSFTPPQFNPGALGLPVQFPDPQRYQVPAPVGLLARAGRGRREYEDSVAQAQAAFDQHCRQAADAEAERVRRLNAYYGEYLLWVTREQERVAAQNRAVDELARRFHHGDAEAVLQYFSTALSSLSWPMSFPQQIRAAWDAQARQFVIDQALPDVDVVPRVSRVRYIKASDRETEIARPATERKNAYRLLLARCALRTVAELFRADQGQLDSVVFNGHIRTMDPATGTLATFYVVTLCASREAMSGIDLARADPIACLEKLRGQLSAKPDRPEAIRPGRLPESVAGVVEDQPDNAEINLLDMNPIEFENLVANLFQRNGLEVMTTARSGDEGVDIVAIDPDPVLGGKIVIQVKRYRSTIPPAVIRELYGTVVAQGATKGILVTTAGFGPGSREFADGKPLRLLAGPELLRMLSDQGYSARIGDLTAA